MKRKRVISLLLSALMCITLLPAGVFAEGAGSEKAAALTAEPCAVHTMEYVEKEEATCQHSGMEAHYYCSVCDNLFAKDDAEGKTPVEGEDLIIPIKEHTWDDGKVTTQATARHPGVYTYTCTVCGAETSEEFDYVEPPVNVKKGYSFSLDGYKLKFDKKNPVVKTPPSFMADARIDHIWIKGGKSNMKVYWNVARKMNYVDGIIILRKDGSASAYKEIKRLKFKVNKKGTMKWSPKTYFVDSAAKKKNVKYSYLVVAYLEEDLNTYISHCSEWAMGQTGSSKLKNIYSAKLNKKSVNLQYKGTATLKTKVTKPKTKLQPAKVRWYSDNKKVAKVSSKGKITATGVGKTVIRARFVSGYDVTCDVSVVGAFKPGTPKLKVDVASKDSISLVWSKASKATSYDLYRSDDGLHWKKPSAKAGTSKIKGTSKKVTGLKEGKRYTFYVVARNDNYGYTALGRNSNVVNQKAVIKRRPSALTGFPTSKTLYAGKTLMLSLAVTSPDGRKANLQKLTGSKWVTQKTVTLPRGAGKVSFKLLFPNSWWGHTTSWRLVIPRSNTSEECISKTLVIKSLRIYQNPKEYVQIKDTISKHGYNYYTSKVLVNSLSTKSDHIEALISTANKYLGDTYLNGYSGAPGKGIDAPGLVMQACFGAGVDLWPISPATRPTNDCTQRIFEASKLGHIDNYKYQPDSTDFVNVYRGDLIFFYTGKKYVGHVAIYLGLGKVIHASQVTGKVETTTLKKLVSKNGKYKYKIAGVRRIFN